MSPCSTPLTISKKSVSLSGERFRVFIEHYYGYDGFFGETVGQKYLLHLPSVYGVKCFGKVYK